MDTLVDERTLREVYLPAFEAAVNCQPWCAPPVKLWWAVVGCAWAVVVGCVLGCVLGCVGCVGCGGLWWAVVRCAWDLDGIAT